MFPMIRDIGLGFMAYSPLGVGLLSGTYKPGEKPQKYSLGFKKKMIMKNS